MSALMKELCSIFQDQQNKHKFIQCCYKLGHRKDEQCYTAEAANILLQEAD